MALWQLALLSLLGVGAGWLNVMAGGGSLLTVPMMLFFGISGPVANGTNRISIIGQNIVAVWGFFSKGFSDFKLSASLAFMASIGAYFGAKVGVQVEGEWFDRLLAGIMMAIMALMVFDRKQEDKVSATNANGSKQPEVAFKPKRLLLGHVLMVGAGFWGGFIQIGVGFLLMPILYRVMGIDLVRTNMHKVFIALIFSFVALFVFASSVQIAWQVGLALAFGNAIGGYIGARTAIAKGAPLIKKVFIIVILMMVVKLLFF